MLTRTDFVFEIHRLCPEAEWEIGFASLDGLQHQCWIDYSFGISIIKRMDMEIIDSISSGPNRKYMNLYADTNALLNQKCHEISRMLTDNGIDALPVPATDHNDPAWKSDPETLRGVLSHKMVATQAGLGWIGKTALLVSRRFGSAVRLATVLTKVSLAPSGKSIHQSECGDCDLCVQSCPAHAANGLSWERSKDRNDFYDAHQCRAFARQISARRLNREISLCGICMAVCPYTQKALK